MMTSRGKVKKLERTIQCIETLQPKVALLSRMD
eukprot:COSAG03_NODE_20603_length_316_cov_1.663594_1_plen_32_part_10